MLQSLQSGRAVAALLVLGFHLGLAIRHYFGLDSLLLPFGHAGVDFFFVLSGFIITMAHAEDVGRPRRVGRFLWKRFARIYPIYWLVFVLAYVGAYRSVALPPGELLKALALVPAEVAPVISVAWSLQWEMVFYLIFAALIVHPLFGLTALLGAWACLPNSSLYLALFLAGGGAALLHRGRLPLPGRSLLVMGALVFAGACAYDGLTGVKPSAWLGLGAALLVLGLSRSERDGHAFGIWRPLRLLGDASYAIYLVHYPVISAGCKLAVHLGLARPAWGAAVYLVLLLTAVGAGVVLHRCIERPMLRALSGRSAP